MKSNAGESSPELEQLLQTLNSVIATGNDSLRDCLRDLDGVLHGDSRKRTNYVPLIAHATRQALKHPSPTAVLLRAIEHMPFRPSPEMILRGALHVERSPVRDELIYDLAGFLEFPVSSKLAEDLERGLRKDFSGFALHIWDRNVLRHSDAAWCRAWGSLCQLILQKLAAGHAKTALDLLEKLIVRIESLQGLQADALGPLVLFLFSWESAGADKGLQGRLARTAAADQARRLIARHTGESDLQIQEPESTESGQTPPVPQGSPFAFQGISLQASHALSVLCDELQSSGRKTLEITERLEPLQLECARLQAENDKVVARENEFQLEFARQEQQLTELTATIRREQGTSVELRLQIEKLDRQLDDTRAALDVRARELRDAQEAYHRLDAQSKQEKADLQLQFVTSLQLELQEPRSMMALMLEMVVRGEREPRHLLSMWNQLDETLTQFVGAESGHSVNFPGSES